MKEISEVVKLTLKNLSQHNIEATPENYEKEFFSIVEKNNIHFNEIDEFHKLINKLSTTDKKSLNSISYREISKLLSSRVKNEDLKYFLKHLSYFMLPSLSSQVKDEINKVCTELSNDPKNLINVNIIRKLRKITNIRINEDKKIFNEKNSDLKKLMSFLSTFLRNRIEKNIITLDEVDNIKHEINSLKLAKSTDDDLKKLYEKFSLVIEEFSDVVNNNNDEIIKGKQESEELYSQIEKLKHNLSLAEEEKSIDFLTKALTRRAYTEEAEKVEREYNAFDSTYVLIFIDLDHFKYINDTYGHDCGDSVLTTFGSILKKLTRDEDIIARYGGEEFICLVHYKNVSDIRNYLIRMKNIIKNNKFVYKDIKLTIKFSAGAALRENYKSYEETLNKADTLLYKAKELGRNKIILDNGEVI
ncbi:GGDEF domain-containing protein [Halarcobacter sp.]|uniref:GGDEF domain-containing protein n=1 Tax=Halarcobacter sp. TaxID=2321133 RepID=UPI002AAA93E8|nr:GGDEF domain-containing protein [Halarcobacter sp.]